MKNFQVKHGQCQSIVFPKTFLLKALSSYQTFSLLPAVDRSWNLSTNLSQSFIPCSAYLEGSLISEKRGVELFPISPKDKLFYLPWRPSGLGDNLTMQLFFLHITTKAFLSFPVWLRRKNSLTLNLMESLLICFENKVFLVARGRVGIRF